MLFTSFAFQPYIQTALADKGFVHPTEVQEKLIPIISKGKSLIGQSQTGSGKTHTFLLPLFDKVQPEKNEVQNILKKFIGYQMQMPPKFSAVKINGKRSYELARNNLEFDMEKRKVFIKNIRLLKHENNKSLFYIKCENE